jgi:uncharacterized protein
VTPHGPGTLALLAAVVFVTSVMGAITGGQSLVNVPVMILCGFGSREAIATNMFAMSFMSLAATVRFSREKLDSRGLTLPMCAIALVTSAVGAQLTVSLPERAVKATIAISMVAMLVFMAARPRFGHAPVEVSSKRRALGYAAAMVLGVYGGLFSGGYTTLLTFVCVMAFGVPLLAAVGLTKPVNFVSCVAATAVFIVGGVVDFVAAVPLALAMIAGGYFGAHLAVKRGDTFVRAVFLVMVAGLALKLLVVDLLGAGGAR